MIKRESAYADYRDLLQQTLSNRKSSSPSYSLRAFARDIKISSSRLCEILKGREGLSRSSAEQVVEHLRLGASDREFFLASVEALHARDKTLKASAQQKVEALKTRRFLGSIPLDSFHFIADWYHVAILERCGRELSTRTELAKAFGLTMSQVEHALERLMRLRLLRKDGDFYATVETEFATPSDIPSRAIELFHSQILSKATGRLTAPVAERDFSSIVFSFTQSDMAEAKKMLKDFRREFTKRFEKNTKTNPQSLVSCLSIQLFNLEDNA